MKHLIFLCLLTLFACRPASLTEIRLGPADGEKLDPAVAEDCIEVLKQRMATLMVEAERITYSEATGNIKLIVPSGSFNPEMLPLIGRSYSFEIWPTRRFDDIEIATAFDEIRADSLGGYLMGNTKFPYGTSGSTAYMDASMVQAEYLIYFEEFLSSDVGLLWGNKVEEVPVAGVITIPALPFYLIDLSSSRNGSPIYGSQVLDTRVQALANGGYGVGIQLDEAGSRQLSVMSRKMANEQRQLALVLNGVVIAAPMVQAPIDNGAVMLTLDYSLKEADGFSSIIEMGEIPVELEVRFVKVLN